MIRRFSILCLTAVALLSPNLLTSGEADAATPTAAWQILQGSDPTVLPPGAAASGSGNEAGVKIHGIIRNLGAAEAESATIADTVSVGASPSPSATAKVWYEGVGGELVIAPCVTAGQTVTCEVGTGIRPGGSVQLFVPLDVAPNPPARIGNEITVASPGVPTAKASFEASTGNQPGVFGFAPGRYGESLTAADEAGEAPTAGSHPFTVAASVHVPTALVGTIDRPVDPLRSLKLAFPSGLVANPMATGARCTLAELNGGIEAPPTGCSPESQVGVVEFEVMNSFATTEPLFNMVPPPGVPAEFAFALEKAVVHVQGGVDGGFHLTAGSTEILSLYPISGITVGLWGNPSDARHDYQRKGVGYAGSGCGSGHEEGCSIPPAAAPFLTMPTSCQGEATFEAAASGWLGGETSASVPLTDIGGAQIQVPGCDKLAFDPSIESNPTTDHGESPSGLDFSIHQPQDQSLDGLATAPLRDASVTLPEGLVLNAAAANGLDSCTEQQMGYAPEEGKVRFETTPQTCPNAAKVGTIEVHTPLLEQPQRGSIYVAQPFANPFGSLLAIYLAIEDEETGIVAKLAGKVEPDPATGQLTAEFVENPQLPLEDIDLHFFEGPRGVLTTPLTCGGHTTVSTLTPWSTPEGAEAKPSSTFQTTVGCSSSEAAASRDWSFEAGTESPLAGAYSPFVLRIARPDGSQHLTGVEMTLPEGLIGKLAGVAYCPESGIAQARSREEPEKGKLEQQQPSCPASSEVGTVNVTAGSGSAPIPVSGHAYLAGPYKGAPLSLVAIVPAVAGPFDLGAVVDRVALDIGEYDARIHAIADPLPTVRNGIPLDVRSVEMKLDRSSFTLNPTSCEAKAIEGTGSTQAGQIVSLNNRFQVGECGRLGFKPKLSLSLKGGTRRSAHPSLRAVVKLPKSGANVASVQVGLPHSEFLDQSNLGKVCTQADLKAATCPKGTVYGHVKAWTPLFDKPLEGPVYLGVGFGYQLPALVAELNGQVRVLLVGKTDTTKKHGLRNTFETVPDAPAEKLVLELKGGPKYGLLVNSENICHRPQKASATFTAANGKVAHLTPTITNSCKARHHKHKKHRKKKRVER
jgi:hypothetical protein